MHIIFKLINTKDKKILKAVRKGGKRYIINKEKKDKNDYQFLTGSQKTVE